ncbi:hypothetical protein [Parafrankia sp. EUN1f]|uniref:hypothetical protein n=1 Tax=Parafrankia sp. EUN1f TaxID=102897 RepID=UPI000561D704|nr:hypothetical protein [Parafrankia sp. EUN1f]
MNAEAAAAAPSTPTSSRGAGSSPAAVKIVTAVIVTVVGLTFLFSFGNILALGLRLGVSLWVAPLVAPAVDLSVVGLLIGIRHLALHGGPADLQRSARRLLIFASIVALTLNISEPLITGHYGKAAFDAVGPLLLIGWAEVGPRLIQAMQTTEPFPVDTLPPAAQTAPLADIPVQSTSQAQPPTQRKSVEPRPSSHHERASDQDLIHRACAEDTLHWKQHHRPISAETLRKRLHVGAPTARHLVTQLRTATHARLDTKIDGSFSASQDDGLSEP